MGVKVVLLVYGALLASVPALLYFPGIVADGGVAVIIALALIVAAATELSSQQRRLSRLVSPVLIAGLASAYLVLFLQIAPMPGGPLMNPIWNSAASALGEKPAGYVTIDTGMTLLAICRLTCMVAVALLAALLGQYRPCAERLLSTLAVITTLVSLERLLSLFWQPGYFKFLPTAAMGAAEFISMFGVVIAVGVMIRGYERLRGARAKTRAPGPLVGSETLVGLALCLVNLGGVACSGEPASSFAALFGAGLVVAILVIRKGRLSPWGQAGTTAVLALGLAAFVAFMPGRIEPEAVTRMIEDARALGVGAGTLTALAPVYGEASVAALPDIPVAATVAIEMGRPFLWLIALIAAVWAALLSRAALKRGRDYIYPAAGAGCIAVFLISALSNSGGLALAPSLILSVVLGLAIAQSKGDAAAAPAHPIPDIASSRFDPHMFGGYLRGALAVYGIVLVMQSVWMLLPEALRPAPIRFPSDQRHATVARQDQEKVYRSATIAALRGDLWAESAFTEAALIWSEAAFETEPSAARNAMTSMSLLKTLHHAPHRSDAWLMLAATCERLKLPKCDAAALLKMSYYTAPDDHGLLPVRLAQALRAKDIPGDDELADMVRRDIRFVLARSAELRPALISAYRTASPAGRLLVERTVTPVDPEYLTMLRAELARNAETDPRQGI